MLSSRLIESLETRLILASEFGVLRERSSEVRR
jgi:hypothetical protein